MGEKPASFNHVVIFLKYLVSHGPYIVQTHMKSVLLLCVFKGPIGPFSQGSFWLKWQVYETISGYIIYSQSKCFCHCCGILSGNHALKKTFKLKFISKTAKMTHSCIIWWEHYPASMTLPGKAANKVSWSQSVDVNLINIYGQWKWAVGWAKLKQIPSWKNCIEPSPCVGCPLCQTARYK